MYHENLFLNDHPYDSRVNHSDAVQAFSIIFRNNKVYMFMVWKNITTGEKYIVLKEGIKDDKNGIK